MTEFALDFSQFTNAIAAGDSVDHAFGPPTAGLLTIFVHANILNLNGPLPTGFAGSRGDIDRGSGRRLNDRIGRSNFELVEGLRTVAAAPRSPRIEQPATPGRSTIARRAVSSSSLIADSDSDSGDTDNADDVSFLRRRPTVTRPDIGSVFDPPRDPPVDVSDEIDFELLDPEGTVVVTRSGMTKLSKHLYKKHQGHP